MAESALASVRGFTYAYPRREHAALRDVSLELPAGSFTVLAGGSGSGKSTLLRALCGLVPHFFGGAASGDLEVGGLDLRENGPGELARVCGTVFQDPESQVVMGGVRAEIALALEHRGTAAVGVARSVEEVALTLGIGHLLDRRTETLSGGELQRVAIAAALAHRPSLLLLDEPTSQLDPVAGDELVWLLRRLNEEWGTAVVIAEHRIERCIAAADRVVALERGRIACDEPPQGFLAWAAEQAPELATPVARLFSLAGLGPLPVSVRAARDRLRAASIAVGHDHQDLPATDAAGSDEPRRQRGERPDPALAARGLWLEIEDGPVVLRDLDLRVAPGERVALMGRNGAGKSTLLRLLKGLDEPTRGRIERAGEVALLLQNPGDYLLGERVGDEVDAAGATRAGLDELIDAHPRDLSGGQRQRLALEIALGEGRPSATLLDEPTRGMDATSKRALVGRIAALAESGTGVIVATHDTEFAAEFADRVVLMGEGVVVADAAAAEVLAGGWHFSTDVARTLGAAAGALTPRQGAAAIERELVG